MDEKKVTALIEKLIDKKLKPIKTSLDDVKAKMADLANVETSMDYLHNQLEKIEKHISEMQTKVKDEVSKLEAESCALKQGSLKTNNNISKIADQLDDHHTISGNLEDLIFYCNAIFMYNFHNNNLPKTFDSFFRKVSESHQYNTRLASKSSLMLPKARTNYGKFNIRYKGAEVWNSIKDEFKALSKRLFKNRMKNSLLHNYYK